MHLIDYYNYAAAAALALIVLCTLLLILHERQKKKDPLQPGSTACGADPVPDRVYWILGCLCLLCGCVLRLVFQGRVPAGLHQDEANIGYESYILATYGVDRDLFPYPVYPITYGAGGGSPLLIYLNVLTTKLFGSNVTVLRRTCAVFGCLTLPVFAWMMCLTEKNHSRAAQTTSTGKDSRIAQSTASGRASFAEQNLHTAHPASKEKTLHSGTARMFFLAAGIFSVMPWHIMLSRWSLDSNTTPFWQLMAMVLLMLAIQKRSTVLYCLCSAFCALCLYSYGSANIVIPLFLLLILPLCMIRRRLTFGQLLAAGVVFVIVYLPLAAFYAVNYLGMPEILTSRFSVNRFTTNRLGNVFTLSGSAILSNLRVLFLNLTVGMTDDSFENFLPAYTQLYRFTFPLTLAGMVMCIRRAFSKRYAGKTSVSALPSAECGSPEDSAATTQECPFPLEMVILTMFLAAVVLSLIVKPRINRFVLMYAPMIAFLVYGADFLFRNARRLAVLAAAILAAGALLFAKDYFLQYNETDEEWLGFMPGYSEAVIYAKSLTDSGVLNGQIYHTRENVNTLYLIALYALKTDPYEYQDTVVYLPLWDEFRHTKSFSNLNYYLPEDVENGDFDAADYPEDIFIVNNYETGLFDPELYQFVMFDRYCVVLPADLDLNIEVE